MSGETMSPGVSAASFSASAGGTSKGGTAEFGGSRSSIGSMDSGPIGSSKSFGGGDQPSMFGKDSPIGSTQSFSEFSPIGKTSGESFEGSIKGIDAFKGTVEIARASSRDNTHAQINPFTDTKPMTVNPGTVYERAFPSNNLGQTTTIAENSMITPATFEARAISNQTEQTVFEDITTGNVTAELDFMTSPDSTSQSVEATVEGYFSADTELGSDVNQPMIVEVLAGLRTEDTEAYQELRADAVELGILQEVIAKSGLEPEIAENLERKALEIILERNGVKEKIRGRIETLTGAEEDPQTQAESEADQENEATVKQRRTRPRTDSDQDGLTDDSIDKSRKGPPKTDEQLVREEPVDEARVSHMSTAIDQAYTPKTEGEEVTGGEVTAYMSPTPSPQEQSGYAKMLGMSGDGTYTELVGEMRERTFDAGDIDQAKAEAKRLAEK
ncbi:MAG: hypothetical protein ACD_37C00478G0001, partial [uncultured bacterium]